MGENRVERGNCRGADLPSRTGGIMSMTIGAIRYS